LSLETSINKKEKRKKRSNKKGIGCMGRTLNKQHQASMAVTLSMYNLIPWCRVLFTRKVGFKAVASKQLSFSLGCTTRTR
jgi:hypothetical protein